MASLQELIGTGEKLGLKGEALQAFVKDQQDLARDERAKDREERDRDREVQLAKANAEKAKIDSDFELEKLKLELAHKKLTVKEEGDLIDEESGEDEDEDEEKHKNIWGKERIKGPKMTAFDERDDMDSYLHRFERYAELQGWKKAVWAIYLAALLKGKALDVYARLPSDQAQDYENLKDALLKRYMMTEEGYKRRFFDTKPEVGESPRQFVTRISSYMLRWIELAKVEKTFDGVSSLIVREQYLSTCSKSLELFLRERAVVDLEELSKLAEQYEGAHASNSSRTQTKKIGETKENNKDEAVKMEAKHDKGVKERRTCFTCGKPGHVAKNCFRKVRAAAMVPRFQAQRDRDHWRENRMERPTHTYSQQRNHNAENNQQGASVVLPTYCKAHSRQYCTDCFSTTPVSHTCNALLAPQVELKCGCTLPVLAEACNAGRDQPRNLPVTEGKLFDRRVSVLRDTGCTAVVVKRDLVPEDKLTGRTISCVLIDGTVRRAPTALVDVDTPFYKGQVEAICLKRPMFELIIGNVQGAIDQVSTTVHERNDELAAESEYTQAALTRSHSAQTTRTKPLKVSELMDSDISVTEVIQLQKQDSTLKPLWEAIEPISKKSCEKNGAIFQVRNGLLYRVSVNQRDTRNQLVLPQQLRGNALKLAHDCIMSGHQGIKKTYDRVYAHFYWSGIHADVDRYCKSCDICQRTVPKGRVTKVPLGNMPLIETPFQRVAIDLVGPIAPMTEKGNRYILTLVDYATRYPEATALKNIEAETVAEALVTMFTRLGVPKEVLSDQGSQFMSSVMKEVSRLLSVTQLVSTPYHPMCNGLVERFNGTLKSMLKRMCSERPKDWDRYIPALLFAYREAPQESLGFSPFELIYGRTVRGPMAILKEILTKEDTEPEVKLTYQFVLDLQERLQETCEIARQSLVKAKQTQKKHFDVKTRNREFRIGDKVLLLLPTDGNKLLMQWKGPYDVIERVNGNNYRIQLPERVKLFHANMLKKYVDRKQASNSDSVELTGAAVIEPDENDDKDLLVDYVKNVGETYLNVQINPDLEPVYHREIRNLIEEFQDVFTDVPGVTNLGQHGIQLTSLDPVRSKAYPVPYAMKDVIDKEIESMLALNIIEPSTAPYASPIVIVKKPDGSNRVCVDFRNLNRISVFDPEPLPQMEDIFSELSGSRYFSKFDFSKGYWQVAMKTEDRDLTTFICHRGLFRFKVMPFGLINAGATFSRIMRKLLVGLSNTRNYLDDVLTYAQRWQQHIQTLRDFLTRVRDANLVLRPSKCFVGFQTVTFLGYQLGPEGLHPTTEMIDKIQKASRPVDKKQLRSFLGMIGYYRSFVPNFAAIAVALTDLTRKGSPNQLVWGEAQENAFQSLKRYVCSPPILRLANVHEPFILQTDASCDGIGAILLQEEEGVRHPVAFASKKLLPRERNYSTIEREALAIVWGVRKFENYLYGRHFFLETDHHPLQYLLKAKYSNGRLMRWALALQPYRFTITAIKGSENVGADFLSRHAF